MADDNRKQLRRTTTIYWLLLFYIVAALVWWFISLEKQNKQLSTIRYNALQLKRNSFSAAEYTEQSGLIEKESNKNTAKYIAEGTTFFILILIGAGFVYRSVRRQFRLQQQQQNFMMAVTHELKTPIATISVALDAINNPKILNDKERIRFYSGIIGNENKRMNAHVENILQMALVDKENFELNEQLLDVHEIILRVVDPVRMQIGSRNGRLNLQLNADNAFVVADEIHLTNVIYNLIDNAIKYSPQGPDITIRTENAKSGVMISFEDKGIGMSTDTQRKIFEKFYREENGNIHNVKGFGLGLAYVKTIVKKHGGHIRVRSELGAGSQFTVYLPFGHFHGLNSAIVTDPKV